MVHQYELVYCQGYIIFGILTKKDALFVIQMLTRDGSEIHIRVGLS